MKREIEGELGFTAWIARTATKDAAVSIVAARAAVEVAVKAGVRDTKRSIGAMITIDRILGKRRKRGKRITAIQVERDILMSAGTEVAMATQAIIIVIDLVTGMIRTRFHAEIGI